ncbi:MAG: lipocalin family protein [Candidatus Cyclobacteriaceae bacterium M2_1C_046]
MRNIIFVLILLLSCDYSQKSDLVGQWTIKSVQDINTGKYAPDELNQGSSWIFNSDNSMTIDFNDNKIWNKVEHGTYTLNHSELFMIIEDDTLISELVEINQNELIFLVYRTDTLKFTLNRITENNTIP